ncbi:MAG: hypothetical protein IKE29_13870 [Paenibacillus sp.]|uniref:hypothetical protein n=1 Tax=Paenibacillus sp. TaxID=58172 RepID=UPI0025DD2502|nr:hypothetical protein [Paenibacillus sp.]MBR2565694.1 hypothetical protein [Paenibacillus sp.]
MKSRTRKHTISSRSGAPPNSLSAVKKRLGPGSKSDPLKPPRGPRRAIPQASVRGLSLPDRTSNQSTVVDSQQNRLDQLALVAAILALIAAAIGLYIAWKTLILPNGTNEIIV